MPFNRRSIPAKNGEHFLLREIAEQDAADLNALILSIISSSPYTLTTPPELDLSTFSQSRRIQQFIQEEGYLILVIEKEGKLVGTLDFKNNAKIRCRHWGEFGMGIRPEYRGLGLGRQLLQGLIEWARANPIIEKINLGVYADNKVALQLYRNMGFEEEGCIRRAIKKENSEYHDEIRMALWVGPDEGKKSK